MSLTPFTPPHPENDYPGISADEDTWHEICDALRDTLNACHDRHPDLTYGDVIHAAKYLAEDLIQDYHEDNPETEPCEDTVPAISETSFHLTPDNDPHHGPLICADCLAERAEESEAEREANFEVAKAIANTLLQALDGYTDVHDETTYHHVFEGLAILHWILQRERDEDDTEVFPPLPNPEPYDG